MPILRLDLAARAAHRLAKGAGGLQLGALCGVVEAHAVQDGAPTVVAGVVLFLIDLLKRLWLEKIEIDLELVNLLL